MMKSIIFAEISLVMISILPIVALVSGTSKASGTSRAPNLALSCEVRAFKKPTAAEIKAAGGSMVLLGEVLVEDRIELKKSDFTCDPDAVAKVTEGEKRIAIAFRVYQCNGLFYAKPGVRFADGTEFQSFVDLDANLNQRVHTQVSNGPLLDMPGGIYDWIEFNCTASEI